MIKQLPGPSRLVLYTKDIELILGCSNRTARRLMQKIKIVSGKTNDQYVTIEEFSEVTGIDEGMVREMMN